MKVGDKIKLRVDAKTVKATFKKGVEMLVIDTDDFYVHLKDNRGRHLRIKKDRMAVCVKKVKK